MRRIFTLLLLATMLGATLRAEPPRPRGRQSVGLVLSGGGAKGIAHIGMIKALEENGIPIDYITGTSMGAIVGGLYAAGYSPEEMLDLIASKDFSYWSTGRINPSDIYYYLTRHDTPAFLTVNLGKDSTQITSVLPVSLINPIPMNYAFIELFAPSTVQCGGDFNRLFVPFRCVTSDVWAKHKVVLRSGPLGDAVRMSMSFPMVFEPISIDGVPMYDGGIYDNYPVDVMMEDFNPDAVIGVNVGSGKSKPDTRNMMAQLEEMIMQPNDYPFPDDRGISIRINLDEFGLLAFGKYQEIYDIGYRRGLEVMDSIKMKVSARVDSASVTARRNSFKAATPDVRIEDVRVSGGNETQDRFLRSFFYHRGEREPLTLQQGRDSYYRAVTACNLQNFVPTPVYNQADSSVTLDFKAVIKDPYTVGIGGYISSSTNSMLFFNAGYNSLSFKSIHTDLNAWLGQSYLAAEGDFTVMADSRRPSAFTVRAVVSRQKYHETEKLFYQIHEPDFIRQSEFYVRAFYSTAPSMRSEFDVGLGYGHLTDKYHTDLREQDTEPGRDRCIFDLGQFKVKWGRNTLDNPFSPSEGSRVTVAAQALWGRYSYTPGSDSPNEPAKQTVKWIQADVQAERYFPLGRRFSIGASGRLLVSTRKLLPTYMASIVAAEAFHPTASSYNYFNTRLRANQFAAACIMPVWNISGQFQLRGIGCAFMPLRSIHSSGASLKPVYGKWFSDPVAFAELQALYRLPFGTVSAYGNYTSSPGAQWNFGISIGAFILAPKFI